MHNIHKKYWNENTNESQNIKYDRIVRWTSSIWNGHKNGKSFAGGNDKIVALEKTRWFHFHLMKTGFLFLLQTIY